MRKQYRNYQTGQKHFTKSQRHRMIVRREKKFKQGNVSQAGRQFRLHVLRLRRARGVWKRALHYKKINAALHRVRRIMGALKYQEYASSRKDPRNAPFRGHEPVIG